MNSYKNIELLIKPEDLTDLQKKYLMTAEQLILNMFSSSPVKIPKNKLSFDGKVFNTITFGSFHKFLLDDITQTIKDNENEHRKFILSTIKDLLKGYPKFNFDKIEDNDLKETVKIIINYYKLSFSIPFPKYLGSENYKNYIEQLETEVLDEFTT